MPNEYTRQRQGRDFSIRRCLSTAETGVGGIFDYTDSVVGNSYDTDKKRSLLDQLEQLTAESERNFAPIDGHEPSERGR